MNELLPPIGWDRQPLPLVVELPGEHGTDRLDLLWPAGCPLPRVGDRIRRPVYVHPAGGPTRTELSEHVVSSITWETARGHGGSERHPMLSVLVLQLSGRVNL